ncbi:MAG: putative selenate reductase subunit YgfK, partial [Spirochaetales bacterium]|nr:putative selenate reductase subunit YgfK [Candidatus Physcosoma equi]
MSDIMRPIPFSELLQRVSGEFRNHNSIFSIHKDQFYKDDGKNTVKVFNEACTTPMGPAAGPHTQLSQNIIASYLVGARFIELKTVQIMDHLEIAKPCIDARDEGFNVEWSTEYTLEKAYDEYLKAWIALHIMEAAILDKEVKTPSFIFNMSCGYNLEGIKEEKMQTYIDSMIDAGKKPLFEDYLLEAKAMLEDGLFDGTDWEGREEKALATLANISKNISP